MKHFNPFECEEGKWYDCINLESFGLPGFMNKGRVLCVKEENGESDTLPAFAIWATHSSFEGGVWRDLEPRLEIFYLSELESSQGGNLLTLSPVQGWE